MINDILTLGAAGFIICGTLILSYREIRKAKIEREINRLKLEAKIQGMRNAKKRKVKAIKRAKARKLEAMKQKNNSVDIMPIINHVLKPEK